MEGPKTETRDTVVTERVEQITVNNEAPLWVWLLLIIGWLMPSPGEIGRSVGKIVWRKKKTRN